MKLVMPIITMGDFKVGVYCTKCTLNTGVPVPVFHITFQFIVFIFQDVLDSKNSAIKDLQYELARVCKAHNDLMRTYESKLTQFGVPTEELGFKALESTVGGQQLGQGAAGLVSAPT
jgi:hypothetical protein